MREDYFRCHYFAGVKFYYSESSECFSTRVFQFPGTVPFLMCSIVENVSSNTTWYWRGIFSVMVFNTRYTYPVCNLECPRYTPVLAFGSHWGSPARPLYRGAYMMEMGKPRCDIPLGNFGTPLLKNSGSVYFHPRPYPGCCISFMLP